MKKYVLIESQSPYDAAGAAHFFQLACDLKGRGAGVEILLVQNGVIPARRDAKFDGLAKALQAGVSVWADDLSMRERAFSENQLFRGVKPAPISLAIERMAGGWNLIWH